MILSKARLRDDYLAEGTTSYVKVTVDGRLAGNAFACRWKYNNRTVCWVTQLVVHSGYREQGLAMGLLSQLRDANDDIYGVMSSHPAACLASAKAFGSISLISIVLITILNTIGSISTVRLDFLKDHAESIMKASPIRYIKDAKLCDSLFDPGYTSGLVSTVDTGFWVDPTDPLEALAWARDNLDWPLGDLLDGHEFLFILQVKRRHHRSRSRSTLRSNDAS